MLSISRSIADCAPGTVLTWERSDDPKLGLALQSGDELFAAMQTRTSDSLGSSWCRLSATAQTSNRRWLLSARARFFRGFEIDLIDDVRHELAATFSWPLFGRRTIRMQTGSVLRFRREFSFVRATPEVILDAADQTLLLRFKCHRAVATMEILHVEQHGETIAAIALIAFFALRFEWLANLD